VSEDLANRLTTINSPTTTDYSWNTRGELTGRTRTEPSAPPTSADTIFLDGFDASLLSTTETFGFDQARRLTGFPGGVTHTYDAHNHRVSTVTPAWGTRYQVYSRSGELLYIEDSGSQQRTEFFHLNGTLVAERTRPLTTETAVVSYLHSDHRGTPTVKTDSASNVHYRSRLMPYGAPYDGIYREGPGFIKHATDDIVQLSYMQQRYYDPDTMRFLSPDPIAAGADSFNVYAYANNNPYTFVDPDGRRACPTGTRLCIEAPSTRKSKSKPTPVSEDAKRENGQLRAAGRGRRLSDGTRLDMTKREQAYSSSSEGTAAPEGVTQRCATCDGKQTTITGFSYRRGDNPGHTHGEGTEQIPGLHDVPTEIGGRRSVITLDTGYVVERTPQGVRALIIYGEGPSSRDKATLESRIEEWNSPVQRTLGEKCPSGC
jgi:RHS repeat-associated protein